VSDRDRDAEERRLARCAARADQVGTDERLALAGAEAVQRPERGGKGEGQEHCRQAAVGAGAEECREMVRRGIGAQAGGGGAAAVPPLGGWGAGAEDDPRRGGRAVERGDGRIGGEGAQLVAGVLGRRGAVQEVQPLDGAQDYLVPAGAPRVVRVLVDEASALAHGHVRGEGQLDPQSLQVRLTRQQVEPRRADGPADGEAVDLQPRAGRYVADLRR
jgi:hypothetical protein